MKNSRSVPATYAGFLLLVCLGGCDGNLYQPDWVLNIDIQMAVADYDLLRYEGRSFASTFRVCVPEYEYNEFVASVSLSCRTN